MTSICLTSDDLALLKKLTPDLNFDDEERTVALLESGSRDVNAVPGSGKTSLLAAKLLLLAKKWTHGNKGICILSHTNVAREEIARRLSQTDEGSRLLAYPHFIGTIHGFVNQFLSLLALRALGQSVDVIDDDVFAKRAMAKLNGSGKYFKLRKWLERQNNAESLVSKLHFSGQHLEILSGGGKLPSDTSDSGRLLRVIKTELAEAGIFRHCDMFAYAHVALGYWPELLDVVPWRFPMVFIDEMQDTSGEQEEILNRLFEGQSVVQRFGDVDQKIISNDADDDERTTFPRDGHLTISTSKRFGPGIADAVASVRVSGLPVQGDATGDMAPVLMLYKTENASLVLHRFGQLVVDRFDADALFGQTVRAMCSRKSGDGRSDPGRHLGDYWPAYAQAQVDSSASGSDSFWRLLEKKPASPSRATISDRASDVRRAVLVVLRVFNSPLVRDVRDGRALTRILAELGGNVSVLQRLIFDLALTPGPFETLESRTVVIESLYGGLGDFIPEHVDFERFKSLDVFVYTPAPAVGVDSPTVCEVVQDGRILAFSLGTVASMKGETHLASLVLESYGGRSKKFDLEVALRCIAGLGKGIDKLTDTQKTQMRNVYVAMSRPTRFLCLAANQSRVTDETRVALLAKGWGIEVMA